MSENFPQNQPPHTEVRDKIEVIRKEFKKLLTSLEELVRRLKLEGSDGEKLLGGLNLSEALKSIESESEQLEKIATASDFIFTLYSKGIIHELARAYAKIRAFYIQDRGFQIFLKSFDSFIQIANESSHMKIKNIPELLTPVDNLTQVLDVEADLVDDDFRNLPKVQRAVKSRIATAQKGQMIVVDFSRISGYQIIDGREIQIGTTAVKIASPAIWGSGDLPREAISDKRKKAIESGLFGKVLDDLNLARQALGMQSLAEVPASWSDDNILFASLFSKTAVRVEGDWVKTYDKKVAQVLNKAWNTSMEEYEMTRYKTEYSILLPQSLRDFDKIR